MNKKKVKSMLIGLLCTVGLLCGTTAHASANYSRIYGADRFETAIAISDEFVNKPAVQNAFWKNNEKGTVILANAYNYPDALTAAPFTRIYNAPILLTGTEELNSKTEVQIKKLGTKNVIIMGGTGVISQSIEDKLHSMGITTERYGGANRYETSMKVANKVYDYLLAGGARTYGDTGMFIATTHNFTDALSVSPLSSKTLFPIVLVPEGMDVKVSDVPGLQELMDKAKKATPEGNKSRTFLVGSCAYVSDEMLKSIKYGIGVGNTSDLYVNSLNAVNAGATFITMPTTYVVASASAFPDSLAGAALAGKLDAPILYANTDTSFNLKNHYNNVFVHNGDKYLESDITKFGPFENVVLLGGNTLTPENSIDYVANIR